MKHVFGIDPDAGRHGLAYFRDGELIDLKMCQSLDVVEHVTKPDDCIVSIENVMANQFVYGRNQKSSKALQSKIAMSVGRVQQAQVELMRMLDYHGIAYVLHKPQAGNWAKNKALFERVTGWKKNSNEDTRAAAYFGWLALTKRAKAC